ncbi:MAG: lipid II flippase family protein [Thermacetogeniaceae bacterium]
MDRIVLVAILTGLIHLVDTLFYGVRFSGVKTRHLATAYSLYQIISILAMTANLVQAPLLSSVVEQAINAGCIAYSAHLNTLRKSIRLIILAGSGGTALAMMVTPLFVVLFNRLIFLFEGIGSIPRLICALFSPARFPKVFHALRSMARAVLFSGWKFSRIYPQGQLHLRLFIANVAVVAIWTTGVLSALYAAAMLPPYRSTATLLSGVVNGIAVVLAAIFIDPVIAMITDQAMQGLRSESEFGQLTFLLILSRLLGTFFAQLLFLPAASLVKYATMLIVQISMLS